MPLGSASGTWINGAVQQAQQAASGGAQSAATAGMTGAFTAPEYGPPSAIPTTPGPYKSGYVAANPTGFGTQVGNQAGGGVAWQQAMNGGSDLARLVYGPQQTALDLEQHNLKRQQGASDGLTALSQRGLQSNFASNMARNALSQRGIGLDREGIGIQRGMLGLDREGLGVQRGYIGKMSGLADRSLEQTLGGINRNLATEQQNTTNEYGARGAYFTPFHRRDLADNYADALQARTEAAQQREGQQYGWDRDLANLGLDDRRIDLRYQDLDVGNKRLDLEAQRLGLDAKDYQTALDQGLAKLGLEGTINSAQLGAMLAGNDQQQAQLAQQMMEAALMYSENPLLMQILGMVTANQGG